MPSLSLLCLISRNSPTRLGMVSPELPQQDVADEVNQEGEAEDLLITSTPVIVEDLIGQGGVGDPPPECQDGLGQWHSGQVIA